MVGWLRKIDDALFSPPHRIEDVLNLLTASLEGDLDPEADDRDCDTKAQGGKEPHPRRDDE